MSEQIIVPALGESVTEATVSKWLKSEGDSVQSDEAIVELETDKVNIEVPSPSSGTLEKISVKEGQTVNVGSLLGSINKSKKSTPEKTEELKKYSPPTKKIEIVQKSEPKIFKENKNSQIKKEKKAEPLILTEVQEEVKPSNKKSSSNFVSPAARKIAAESKIDLTNVQGSGKNGLVLKEDLIHLMGKSPNPSERKISHGPEERIKMTRLRLTVAKRLKQAQENAAMLTTFNEVDMQEVISMRNNYKDEFQKKYSVKLGFMSFFVKASVVALKNFPAVNAEIEGDEIIYKNYYNISIAVGTEKGLVVPVLRDVDELSFADIEKNIKIISDKAQNGKLTIEDLQGGTFTISNGGVYGSMLSTPILNPPQSGVLGMHNIVERPTIVDGDIKIRPIMYLALSYDHRIIDGKDSVSFLKLVKEHLEDPRRLFLDI